VNPTRGLLRSTRTGALAVFLATAARAQVTQRVSVDSSGAQADSASLLPVISPDGRYVAFESIASNLVPGDTNITWDVFLRDRWLGTTQRVSVATGGAQSDSACRRPAMSADGRVIAFHSRATNLVAGDTNGTDDVFVRDRHSATTARVSLANGGVEAHGNSRDAAMSADGRYVAFESDAPDLVAGDTNLAVDVFVHDRTTGTTERVSVATGGTQANSASMHASISADGRYVAFHSFATNLVPGDTNGSIDVFVRDRQLGTTDRVSVDTGGAQANSDSLWPCISADGRFVAFESSASNLAAGDTNLAWDVFVHDRQTGTTERVSVGSGSGLVQGDGGSHAPSISSDGRFVAFESDATNLIGGDTNGVRDVFVRDRERARTERVSIASASAGLAQGDGDSTSARITDDGRFVTFASGATDLVSGDTNAQDDVFVHDRDAAGFASLCDAGVNGVIPCPCANAPSGPGRGCDNSSATGGATLSASGIAYLSMDTLELTTSGELPSAASTVMQGNALVASGVVFGQGVRCAGGSLVRLYTKDAVGGDILRTSERAIRRSPRAPPRSAT
jgi:Tol biopolymer transport system component